MKAVNYKIVMPTVAKYLPITDNFLSILKVNWPQAMDNIIVSVVGDISKWSNVHNVAVINNPKGTTLPGCIVNAVQQYEADIYLSFLGDAFLNGKIDDKKIHSLMRELISQKISYCNLVPQIHIEVGNRINRSFRLLSNRERYGHSFVAFACTREFIESEFLNEESDRDFEIKYLKLAQEPKFMFEDRAILKENIFHIYPSIQKGKWNRIRIRSLRNKYPQVEFENLGVISPGYELFLVLRRVIIPFLPNDLAKSVKSKLKRKVNYFDTDD